MSLAAHFLLLLAAVAIEFVVGGVAAWRSTRWSYDWLAWLERVCGRHAAWQGMLAIVTIVAVPALAVLVVEALLRDVSAVFAHAFALGVLVLMLGPEDLEAEVAIHRRRLRGEAGGDEVPVYLRAAERVELGPTSGDDEFDASRAELAALALAASRAWYVPLFWFLVAGPVGAVAWRLCSNLRRADGLDPAAAALLADLREALDFVPARITLVACGLAGTLLPVLESTRAVGLLRWGASRELVARAALAAVDHGRVRELIVDDARLYRLNQVMSLLRRTLVVWLVFAAVTALAA